jgi:hypothetical protein
MGIVPEWAAAEDAFLSVECEMVRDAQSVRFESKQNTRRLNGVRILDIEALDEAGWSAELARHARAFAGRGMPLSVKLAQPLTGDMLPGEWRVAGPTYHHVATDIADFAGESQRAVRLEELATDEQVNAFVDMMMVGRVPEHMHEKARPSIRALVRRVMGRENVTMQLAYDGSDLVGQVALVEAKGDHCHGYNVSTLSVALPARGKGYMKALYAAIAAAFEGQLYGQIIDGKPTLAYRRRFPSTRVLATINTYQRVDDPHGDHWPG